MTMVTALERPWKAKRCGAGCRDAVATTRCEQHADDGGQVRRGAEWQRGMELGRDSASRRTYLAAERTYLAWLRSGLASLDIALAVGRLIPALIEESHVEFGLLGLGYGALGVVLLLIGAYRDQRVRAALVADRPLPMDAW